MDVGVIENNFLVGHKNMIDVDTSFRVPHNEGKEKK